MATFMKCSGSSQRLILLALLVLLAFSAVPAPIRSQSIDGRKSKMMVGDNKVIVHDDDDIFNGCHYNEKFHDSSALFCCSKDKLCWPSLPECAANCPCKINCGG